MPAYINKDMTSTDLERIVVPRLKCNVRVNPDSSFDEFVMCDDNIGYYYSPRKGQYISTRCAQIKYSLGRNKNIHIIPVKEFKGYEVIYNDEEP